MCECERLQAAEARVKELEAEVYRLTQVGRVQFDTVGNEVKVVPADAVVLDRLPTFSEVLQVTQPSAHLTAQNITTLIQQRVINDDGSER